VVGRAEDAAGQQTRRAIAPIGWLRGAALLLVLLLAACGGAAPDAAPPAGATRAAAPATNPPAPPTPIPATTVPATPVPATATVPAAPAPVDVQVLDNRFEPPYVEVRAGTLVRWSNRGTDDHDVVAEDLKAFESPLLKPGQTFELTLTTPGAIPYLCTLHDNMTGTIVVQ
jgi:plastocyanin